MTPYSPEQKWQGASWDTHSYPCHKLYLRHMVRRVAWLTIHRSWPCTGASGECRLAVASREHPVDIVRDPIADLSRNQGVFNRGEAVDVRSGYVQNDLGAYVEFRDDRVSFFVQSLARGRHSVSYRLRAEIPGRFSALPARASAMYAPELRANSDELRLKIED